MQHTAPKSTKLLCATVEGLGVVTAVSVGVTWPYALIEDEHGVRHHCYLANLNKDAVTYPVVPQSYVTQNERIGYGVWEEVYGLLPAQTALQVAA